jgi:hypothetical protein
MDLLSYPFYFSSSMVDSAHGSLQYHHQKVHQFFPVVLAAQQNSLSFESQMQPVLQKVLD